jgi:hypothetical protein
MSLGAGGPLLLGVGQKSCLAASFNIPKQEGAEMPGVHIQKKMRGVTYSDFRFISHFETREDRGRAWPGA